MALTISLFYFAGERQKKLSEALERAPPKAYLEAVEALLTWLRNNEAVIESEKFCVQELSVMENQLKQFKVPGCFFFESKKFTEKYFEKEKLLVNGIVTFPKCFSSIPRRSHHFNSLPTNKILDWSKFKAFPDNKILLGWVENILGKGEWFPAFSPFPTVFKRPFRQGH